jgi:hypothetical protein
VIPYVSAISWREQATFLGMTLLMLEPTIYRTLDDHFLFGFIVIQEICSKSIQNVTIDDNKVVTTDMLENWKKNMTDWMTELFERKFSS